MNTGEARVEKSSSTTCSTLVIGPDATRARRGSLRRFFCPPDCAGPTAWKAKHKIAVFVSTVAFVCKLVHPLGIFTGYSGRVGALVFERKNIQLFNI